MIVITGGSGFIGSALLWRLNQRGITDILVVDHLADSEKWKNLVPLEFSDYLDRQEFIARLERGDFGNTIEAVFHLGACSSTTEKNADYLIENNYRYSVRIAEWRERHAGCRMIYASSAATYGDGSAGYADDEALLHTLRPLNMYGYSKHLFDLYALRRGWLKNIAGLKYFNVFGPNEYHKGDMRSVICKAYPGVRDTGSMELFKSHRDGCADGEQQRDFLYVKDAVEMTLFFYDKHGANGIFNIGTGTPRSWNDVAGALFAATDKKPSISYVPMPENIRGKYQYYTCADLTRLRRAGCTHECMSLEDAVGEYACSHLSTGAVLQ
ncbi:MAG: ADP-glyceromanno-heptose 6-epimerase [Chitinispirillaceae bacterium]|jgi:ADP-L-glycero-D-manno-heptose 6-epimerase|nr:ADP-glyceromanno-heptose 6-epimerase [Chitinispirillaceae bacterium]